MADSIDSFLGQWSAAEQAGDAGQLDALLTSDFAGIATGRGHSNGYRGGGTFVPGTAPAEDSPRPAPSGDAPSRGVLVACRVKQHTRRPRGSDGCSQAWRAGVTGQAWPARYEIRVGGVLDSRRADWFGGLAAGWDGSQTVISVLLADQAAP